VSIKADSAFELLNNETGGSTETEDELIALTNRAIAIATSPKLNEQEFEADRMALLYLARSGYDLKGLPRMLTTMMERHEKNIDMFDLNYRNHPDFNVRTALVGKEIEKYRKYSGKTFAEEYSANMIF
jgi:predicted Zn-dependent protease